MEKKCFYCGLEHGDPPNDLRPYGPGGSFVCFPCAMSTPAREAAAYQNFKNQLDGCGPVAVIDGTEVGPYPIEHLQLAERQDA